MADNKTPVQPDPVQQVVNPENNISTDASLVELQKMLDATNSENEQLKKLVAAAGDKTNGPDAEALAKLSDQLREAQNQRDELSRLLELKNTEIETEVTSTPSAFKKPKPFTLDKKKYRVNYPKVNIPGMGERTAAEIMLDTEAQRYLVDSKSGFISEITD